MMKKTTLSLLLSCSLATLGTALLAAQTPSASSHTEAQAPADRTVPFLLSAPGENKPITWGLDLAWLSRDNVVRGMRFMNPETVDVVRSSFTPTDSLVDGELKPYELGRLNERLDIISLLPPHTQVVLNCDHPSVSPYFKGNPKHWAELIDVTRRHHEAAGRKVVTVSPFNEPDLTETGQGTLEDFYHIAEELRRMPAFDSIRISGGNTLNTDRALEYYTYLRDQLDEGNTHQLAGTFDHYAEFFQTVRADGRHATNDELHNVMEAMVGSEYGLQTGIWWGSAEYARGEFCKATDGQRLAYAEHRPNWTAASVYRAPDGKVQAFGGASERQAATTSYRFVSQERDVYFDGHGPLREFTLEIPGGTGYQVDQPSAERVINVTWGDDIQPVIDGEYLIANRGSMKVMTLSGGSASSGTSIVQQSNRAYDYQHWTVRPVDSRVGGDFSYYSIYSDFSKMNIDLLNWSLEEGGGIIIYTAGTGTNQQWVLEYAGDGWFYIRSRHSGLYLEVAGGSKTDGAAVQQAEKTGENCQLWRFIPVGNRVEFTAPAAPTGLTATALPAAVGLNWKGSTSIDAKAYAVFRSEQAGGPYDLIARGIEDTTFTDNKAEAGKTYYYALKTEDKSTNLSDYSEEISCSPAGGNTLLMRLAFEGNLQDATPNGNHGAAPSGESYTEGKNGEQALAMDGEKTFVQLPTLIARHKALTMAAWVWWDGSRSNERIFDFGDGGDLQFYLTPRNNSGRMEFVFRNGDEEQTVLTGVLPQGRWVHTVVSIDSSALTYYMDGEKLFASQKITLKPSDFNFILNYVGRGQDKEAPFFSGKIDDLRVYNYALSDAEAAQLAENRPDALEETADDDADKRLSFGPSPARESFSVDYSAPDEQGKTRLTIFNSAGTAVEHQESQGSLHTTVDTSALPAGIYILQIEHKTEKIVCRFFVEN